ncbi:hypothetical protein SDC9_161682 [bioreactor metagenome]|uniref:Uncharacterized protein n=1 Tax=bioreactor metagenome TaxID=1076179 RepID=A0A645FIV6_9ZZZZ
MARAFRTLPEAGTWAKKKSMIIESSCTFQQIVKEGNQSLSSRKNGVPREAGAPKMMPFPFFIEMKRSTPMVMR